jgi:hypothetical protein
MGSWNETCGISQLPILMGDKIVCHVIVNDYSHKLFMFPLTGEYADYGCIENIQEDEISNMTLDDINEMIANDILSIQPDCYKNHPEEFDTIEKFCKFVERGLVKYQDRYLNLFMCHKNIHDVICEDIKRRELYGKGINYDEGVRNKIQSHIDSIVEEMSIFGRSFTRHHMILGVNTMDTYLFGNHINHIIKTPGDKTSEEILNRLVNIRAFYSAMMLLRKTIMPQEGKGSQSNELELHLLILDEIKDHYDNILKECDGDIETKETFFDV